MRSPTSTASAPLFKATEWEDNRSGFDIWYRNSENSQQQLAGLQPEEEKSELPVYKEAVEYMDPTEYQNLGSRNGCLELTDAGMEEVVMERGVKRDRQRVFLDPYVTDPRARH